MLALQLECSERYIAGLLLKMPSTLSVEQKIEGVISLFHTRRTVVLDSVDLLLSVALATEKGAVISPLASRVTSFLRSQLISVTAPSTWVSKVFKEMEGLTQTIERVAQVARSAPSFTVPPGASGTYLGAPPTQALTLGTPANPTFGSDILVERVHALESERRRIVGFYLSFARLGALRSADLKVLVGWVALNPTHPTAYPLLAALLYSLDSEDPETQLGQSRLALGSDATFVSFMLKKLAPANHDWKDLGLKAVVLLKWTLYQIDARESDPRLESQPGFSSDELETQLANGVQGDSFVYLSRTILHIRDERHTLGLAPLVILPPAPESQPQPEAPTGDLALVILGSFEILIRSLVFYATPELRKIKQRQEDVVLATARTAAHPSRFASKSVHHPVSDTTPPRNDIATLFSLIGLLYSSLDPEYALQFWGSGPSDRQSTYLQLAESGLGRLPAFLQWAVWSTQSQHPGQVTALYNLLGGLAKGRHCSELAYNFMAGGGGEIIPGSSMPSSSHSNSSASWQYVFNTLAAFATPSGRSLYPGGAPFSLSTSHPTQHQGAPNALSPENVLLGRSFLVLLSTVVSYSVAVRKAIFTSSHLRPLPSLANLISLGIPLELKGAIFDTLAAFCQPGAGAEGLDICRNVWSMLEKLEVINVRPIQSGFGALSAVKGVEVELEQVEAANRTYPVTIPFLHLLCTLLHTPKRIVLRERDDALTFTIPPTLGQPYRSPGIGPYVSFVLDNVLSNITGREFSNPSDQWEMMGLCLCFIERSLASYNLEELIPL